jgi:hypothetical protein
VGSRAKTLLPTDRPYVVLAFAGTVVGIYDSMNGQVNPEGTKT